MINRKNLQFQRLRLNSFTLHPLNSSHLIFKITRNSNPLKTNLTTERKEPKTFSPKINDDL